jgi:phosphomannomutase
MKRRTNESGALAGFEKSGHFFFNAPLGRGYDDGLISAIAVCEMLDRNPGKIDGGSEKRAAENLVVADHVAALRGRDQIRRRR